MKQQWCLTLAALGIAFAASAATSEAPSAHPVSFCSDYAAEAAERAGLGVDVIERVMRAESGGDARAVSPKGAIGCMQIMPPTWADLTVRYALGPDPFDPRINMVAGALYLAELTRMFGPAGAYAAYNAGPARYVRYTAGGAPLPAETVGYVARLRRESLPAVSEPARVRWQAAALFLAHVDTSDTAYSRTAFQPAAVARMPSSDPTPQAFASRVKTPQTLFPLSRDEPLPHAR